MNQVTFSIDTKVRTVYSTYLATSGTSILIPGVSLLLEQPQDWITIIQELILYSALFLNRFSASQLTTNTSTVSNSTINFSTQTNDLQFFYNFFGAIRKSTTGLIERELDMFKARNISQALNELSISMQDICNYFNSNPVNNETPSLSSASLSTSFPQLMVQLDLFPPPLGFLESNHTAQMFPENSRIEMDVVSKKRIDKKIGNYKQCSKCHRISIACLNQNISGTTQHEEVNSSKPWWFKRYELCCPICGNIYPSI